MSRERRLSIILALFSVLFTCGAIESFLRATVSMSAAATSVIHKDWQARYWTPINMLGYRDVDPHSADLTNVLVIGDSFISGYGVNTIEDRISGQLQILLGDTYGVNIAADIAWETPREFEALQTYPVHPDFVIWSHFSNDILHTLPNYPDVYPHQTFVEYASEQFYATTLIYRAFNRLPPDNLVENTYSDVDAVQQHLALLQQVIDYCEANNIELIFVLWDLPTRHETTPHISSFLDTQDLPYVDTDIFERGLPLVEIAASPLDGHPNARMHTLAAGLVHELIVDARR